jgi:hypothetical protein
VQRQSTLTSLLVKRLLAARDAGRLCRHHFHQSSPRLFVFLFEHPASPNLAIVALSPLVSDRPLHFPPAIALRRPVRRQRPRHCLVWYREEHTHASEPLSYRPPATFKLFETIS